MLTALPQTMACSVQHCCIYYTSKEKHSLTRKMVGYRNWRQRWCKKEGNKVLGKGIYETKTLFRTCKCNRTKRNAKYRIFVSFSFSQNLVPLLFTPPLPLSHQLSRFSLLVSCRRVIHNYTMYMHVFLKVATIQYDNYKSSWWYNYNI